VKNCNFCFCSLQSAQALFRRDGKIKQLLIANFLTNISGKIVKSVHILSKLYQDKVLTFSRHSAYIWIFHFFLCHLVFNLIASVCQHTVATLQMSNVNIWSIYGLSQCKGKHRRSHCSNFVVHKYNYYTTLHLFNGLFSRKTRISRHQKGKPFCFFCCSKRRRGGSDISWTICKLSAPRSRRLTTLVPHHSVFFTAGCLSCHPTNSIKALKAWLHKYNIKQTGKMAGGRW